MNVWLSSNNHYSNIILTFIILTIIIQLLSEVFFYLYIYQGLNRKTLNSEYIILVLFEEDEDT